MVLLTIMCWLLTITTILLMESLPRDALLVMVLPFWASIIALGVSFLMFVISTYERRRELAVANGILILIGLSYAGLMTIRAPESKKLDEQIREKYSGAGKKYEDNQPADSTSGQEPSWESP